MLLFSILWCIMFPVIPGSCYVMSVQLCSGCCPPHNGGLCQEGHLITELWGIMIVYGIVMGMVCCQHGQCSVRCRDSKKSFNPSRRGICTYRYIYKLIYLLVLPFLNNHVISSRKLINASLRHCHVREFCTYLRHEISMLISMLVDKKFQTCQPIRSHVWKSLLCNCCCPPQSSRRAT